MCSHMTGHMFYEIYGRVGLSLISYSAIKIILYHLCLELQGGTLEMFLLAFHLVFPSLNHTMPSKLYHFRLEIPVGTLEILFLAFHPEFPRNSSNVNGGLGV